MRKTLIYLSIAIAVLVPSSALAANLSVFPASIQLNKGDAVGFIVRMQSDDSINTIGATVVIPPNLAFLSVTGGTVINDWVQNPSFDSASNTVSFSGIIPNGWTGDGQLVTVKVAAKVSGTYSLSFDQSQTEVYKNDGKATPEPISYTAAPIPILNTPVVLALAVILALLLLLAYILKRKYTVTIV